MYTKTKNLIPGTTVALADLDRQIAEWEQLVADFPLSQAYKNLLGRLKTERELLAATIGTKKEA